MCFLEKKLFFWNYMNWNYFWKKNTGFEILVFSNWRKLGKQSQMNFPPLYHIFNHSPPHAHIFNWVKTLKETKKIQKSKWKISFRNKMVLKWNCFHSISNAKILWNTEKSWVEKFQLGFFSCKVSCRENSHFSHSSIWI